MVQMLVSDALVANCTSRPSAHVHLPRPFNLRPPPGWNQMSYNCVSADPRSCFSVIVELPRCVLVQADSVVPTKFWMASDEDDIEAGNAQGTPSDATRVDTTSTRQECAMLGIVISVIAQEAVVPANILTPAITFCPADVDEQDRRGARWEDRRGHAG